VRECHGDLHLGNLVLIDGRVVPFDGIEFNEDFRWNDVASEVAFTYIDLLDHGRPDLAAWFLNEWLTWSGDFDAIDVLPFYAVYRALVRAKIAGIRHDPAEAIGYFDLAQGLTSAPPPRLVITHGVSGSGKSHASTALLMADRTARTLRLRSDVERKRLFGLAPDAASEGRIYTPEANHRTYERLAELCGQLLAKGWSVIVDAAFLKRSERDAFHALALRLDVPFAILPCTAPRDELHRRLDARRDDPSEATVEVVEKQLEWIEALAADEEALVLAAAPSA
jgi:predicted kinase